ncbi:MAG: superfamily II DNA/RNA helicase [Planctomycetota bacterium]|jgi:superfamily II DNA/RNA helicase
MQTTTSRHGRSSSVRGSKRTNSGGGSRRDDSRGRRPQGQGGSNYGNRNSTQRREPRKMPTFDPSKFINTNPVELKEEVYVPTHTFATFGLDEKIVETITRMGITIPSPIQDQVIPEILAGKDVIGLAETGTGKTAAFLVPILEKTLQNRTNQTLIIAPTRELAIQIEDELKKLARGMRMFSVVCVGGMNIRPQIKMLRHPNQFIIGTPGRLIDLMDRGNFDPSNISTVILDEADRMLDMGFINDMRSILKKTPSDRQTLLFSATMSTSAEKFAQDFLQKPVSISVKKKDVTNSIEQNVVPYKHTEKFETLTDLLSGEAFKRVLVFGSMKHSVEKLARQLSESGHRAESIHGNKSHGQRQRALTQFKNGHAQVLVATDVAARGIHVDSVSHVINYDLPNTFEDYVHRIGRTGRGSNRGKALTFVPGGSRR